MALKIILQGLARFVSSLAYEEDGQDLKLDFTLKEEGEPLPKNLVIKKRGDGADLTLILTEDKKSSK